MALLLPSNDPDDADLQRIRQIDEQYEEDYAKLQKVRKLLSKKKRVRGALVASDPSARALVLVC